MSLSPANWEGVKPSMTSIFTQIAGITGFQASNLWNFLFFSQNAFNGNGHYMTYEERRSYIEAENKKKSIKGEPRKMYSPGSGSGKSGYTPPQTKSYTFYSDAEEEARDAADDQMDKADDNDTPAWLNMTDSILLSALTQSVSLAFPSIDTEPTWANYNHIAKYNPISEDIRMTFLENNLMSVTNFFNDWFDEIYDPKLMAFKPGNKKLDGILLFYAYPLSILEGDDADLNVIADLSVPIGWFHFEGLLFKGLDGIEANYGSSDIMKVSAKFSCDKISTHRWLG